MDFKHKYYIQKNQKSQLNLKNFTNLSNFAQTFYKHPFDVILSEAERSRKIPFHLKGVFMITFISFILTILGCINWLLVGLLQYDFIAGLFGFQASIFSRIFYILFGIASVYLVIRAIVNKGTFKVYERKKKKEKAEKQEVKNQQAPAYANVEAGKEQTPQTNQNQNLNPENQRSFYADNQSREQNSQNDSLFDEHMKKF